MRSRSLLFIMVMFLCANTAFAQSLRQRIAARQEVIRVQNRIERVKSKPLPFDPDRDLDFWRITRHSVPICRSVLSMYRRKTCEGRFYASAPANSCIREYSLGSHMYFYEFKNGVIHLAGRGIIRKLRKSPNACIVEARIDAFRYARWKTVYHQRGIPQAAVLKSGYRTAKEKWYMSPKLTGPDTEGWTPDHREAYVQGNIWVGICETAVYGIHGAPTRVIADGGTKKRLFFQNRNKARSRGMPNIITTVFIGNGQVTAMDPPPMVVFQAPTTINPIVPLATVPAVQPVYDHMVPVAQPDYGHIPDSTVPPVSGDVVVVEGVTFPANGVHELWKTVDGKMVKIKVVDGKVVSR